MAIDLLLNGKFTKGGVLTCSTKDKKLVENLHVRKFNITGKFNFKNIIVSKPWGMEYLCGQNRNLEVWELYINKSDSTSLHCHPNKDTFNIILEGKVILETTKKREIMNVGDFRIIKSGVIHRTINSNYIPRARILEIESPPDKYNLIRIKDSYGRDSVGYQTIKKNNFPSNKIKKCLLPNCDIKDGQIFLREFIVQKNITKEINLYEIFAKKINKCECEVSKKMKLLNFKNIILTDGLLVGSNGKQSIKMHPGDCICGVQLWKFNWSGINFKAILW